MENKNEESYIWNMDGGTITAWVQERTGVIGAFQADNKETAQKLITNAVQYLKERNCVTVLGPMNQNTWHSYRFLKETSLEHPFFMEPAQPLEYLEWFEAEGFVVDQNYYSFLTDLSSFVRKRSRVAEAFLKKGIQLKDGTGLTDEELLKMNYEISRICFAKNVYYSPVSYETYRNIYQPSLSLLKKEYVYYAYDGNTPVGFLFGIPDYNEPRRGQKQETILFKTFAVLPEYRHQGIASGLMECVADVAKEHGYTRGIMALVHEKNFTMAMLPDQKMCSHYVLLRRDFHA